jgi:PAS domain S-box-containing protein
MRANIDRQPTSDRPQEADGLALLAAAVGDGDRSVAVVDGRAGGSRIAYANQAFRARARQGLRELADFRVSDAPGPELEAAIAACCEGDAVVRRVAYQRDGAVRTLAVTVTRHAISGEGPWYVAVVQDPVDEGACPDPEVARSPLLRAATRAGAGHWDWDLLAGRVWYEPEFKAMLGYQPADMDDTFAALQRLMHDDDRPLVLQALRLQIEQRQPFDMPLRLRRADGEYRWYRLCGSATRDPSGRPMYLSGRLEDFESTRAATERLRRSEESLRRTLDGLSFAVGVLNSDGELVEINRAWRDFEGDRALIGLRYGFGENYARLCRVAIDRCAAGPMAAAGVADVIAGRQSEFALEYRVPEEDGERALEMRVRPLEVGGRRGAIVTHQDMSELEKAHQKARSTQEFYELILDSLPVCIAYVNRRREFVYANRPYEEWFQLPLAALAGRRLEEMTTPENYRAMAPRVESVLSGRTVEYTSRTARSERDHDLSVTYLPHRVGDSVEGFFSVVQDVTTERRLESELRHSQKLEAVGQLTGGIAHDFNNVLSVVIGNLQLLERPLQPDMRLLGHVSAALRAALRGADLTRRLLAFARQQVLEPRVLSPSRMMSGTADLIRRTLGATIEVQTDFSSDAHPIYVDPAQFESSILNLAINARDAMPGGGRLTLTVRNRTLAEDDRERHPKLAAGEYVEVSVADTGVGMAPIVLKRAFEPFFTTKETGKGTGLGLSMVYGFVEQSGGIATIESEVGVGTAIRLVFPRSFIPDGGAVDGAGAAVELPPGTETVLVVDDDVDVRKTAAAALRMLGYRVLEEGNGAAALSTLSREPDVALILADLVLPGGMLGAELADRAIEARPSLRVLHTSGFAHPRQGDGAGDRELLNKPYAIGELARRVRALLDRERVNAD